METEKRMAFDTTASNVPENMLTIFQTKNLAGSGIEVVLAHTMYAIVGAITLQNGGEVGNRIVKERVLNPLGL